MFDIAFSEIVLIAVVALVVIGPERLPKVARTLGHMFGRLQRYVNEVKADITREIELDELRKLKNEVQTAAQNLEHSVTQAAHDVESGVRSVETELNAADAGASTPSEPERADPVTPAATSATDSASAVAPAGSEPPRQATLPGVDRI
jgi:sec-independent protein translocase protein TatB